MIDLLDKEVLKASSSLGENLCPAGQYEFFKNLVGSETCEILEVYYGDKYAYACPVLVTAVTGSANFNINGILVSADSYSFNDETFYLELCLDGSWEVQISDNDFNPIGFIDFTADVPAVI